MGESIDKDKQHCSQNAKSVITAPTCSQAACLNFINWPKSAALDGQILGGCQHGGGGALRKEERPDLMMF